MKRALLLLLAFPFGPVWLSAAESSLLDQGYRQMYNLRFQDAHKTFEAWEKSHPADPMGPASDAAAYLFAEFDRLHILESEFFIDDSSFHEPNRAVPDPRARALFEQALDHAQQLSGRALAESPSDGNATFASVLRLGLHADYQALIEKKYAASLSEMKAARLLAQQLVATNPALYDAYLAIGVENYILSQKIAPVRWLLRLKGAATDKDEGLKNLRITSERGRYLLPFARLLLAVAALRGNDRPAAASILRGLAREFPGNRLYARELSKISGNSP